MNSNINYISYIFSLWSQKFEKIQDKLCLIGCKWSSLDAPGTESPLSHSGWENSISSFSWGNKELALPSMKVKSWKIFRTKLAQQAANGPVWMPRALKPLCLVHIGRIPFPGAIRNWHSPLSPVWKSRVGKISEQNWLNRLQMVQFECHRHWAPSMKVKSWKNFRTKLAQQAANGPVWMP